MNPRFGKENHFPRDCHPYGTSMAYVFLNSCMVVTGFTGGSIRTSPTGTTLPVTVISQRTLGMLSTAEDTGVMS
jgi:hypothetical protein